VVGQDAHRDVAAALERLPDAGVYALTSLGRHPLVKGLANQGMREAVAPALRSTLDDEPRGERLLERGQKVLFAQTDQLLHQPGVEVPPNHGRDAKPIHGRRSQVTHPSPDHLLDAFG
jgi:hypothetical protein